MRIVAGQFRFMYQRRGKGAPAGGTVGGKDGQHTAGGSRLHVTTPDSRPGQISLGDGGGHRLASWTRGYATARSEAICRGAGCGRTRTSGSVGGQGQQRPWSTRPRLGGGLVVAARDPVKHARQQPVVDFTIATPRLVGTERNFTPRHTAHPWHANWHPLPRQTHRPGVGAVTASPDRRVLPGVALAGQRRHLLVEHLLHVHQAQGDQGPDQLHFGVELQIGVVLALDDVDRAQRATLLALPDWSRTLLISAPFARGVMPVFVNVIKPQRVGAVLISN